MPKLAGTIVLGSTLILGCTPSSPATTPMPSAVPTAATPSEANTASALPARSAPPRGACLPAATRQAAVAHAEVRGKTAMACYAEGDAYVEPGKIYACLVVDLETRTVTGEKTWTASERPPPAPPPFEVTTTKDSVKVCPKDSKTCSTFKVRHKPIAAGHGESGSDDSVIASVNADGTRAFVFAPELLPGQPKGLTTSYTVYGDLYEVKTGKRLTHIQLGLLVGPSMFRDPTNLWNARFIGKNVFLSDYVCCGPGGSTALVNLPERHGRQLHGYDGDFEPVKGDVYYTRSAKYVALIDAATLKQLASVSAPGDGLDNPEMPEARVAVSESTLVVAYANPPGLLTLDTETLKASDPLPLPLCPAEATP